jgi:hypothetical protein
MKYLALSAAVFLVACNGSDTPSTTQVDPDTAASALAALHLANSGDGIVSYGAREFDGGVYTFTDVVFTDMAQPDEDDVMVVDGEGFEREVELDEMHAARMVLAGPRFDDDGNVIFDRLTIEEGRFVDPQDGNDGEGGFASMILETPNAAMVADLARIFAGADDDDLDGEGYQFGLVAINDLSMSGTDGETGETFAVAMDRFAMDDFDGESLQRFELIGFDVNAMADEIGPVRIQLAELSMDGLGQALFASFGEGMRSAMAEAAGETPEAYELPDDYDPMDAYDSFSMRGLDVNVGGVLVTMDSMTGEIDRSGNLIVGTTELTPLVIRPDTEYQLGAQLALGLGMLGYQQLEFTAAGESVYDVDTDRSYTRGDNYFEMTDGFRIETEMDMSGILEYSARAMTMSMASDSDMDPLAMFEPLILNRLVLRIEDQSILDRALTAGSAAQGMSKAELRQQASAMISLGMLGAPAEIPRPLLVELSEALVGFVNNGGNVVITLDPDAPVSVGDLARQAESQALDYEALGLTIAHEASDVE